MLLLHNTERHSLLTGKDKSVPKHVAAAQVPDNTCLYNDARPLKGRDAAAAQLGKDSQLIKIFEPLQSVASATQYRESSQQIKIRTCTEVCCCCRSA